MSALARYCKFKGCEVLGYDRTPSDLTKALEAEGMPVHYENAPERIPKDIAQTLVVYTPAVSEDFGELRYAKERGYKVAKRSQLLGEITRDARCIAVAGTHGKTSTSSLIAHILYSQGTGCSAFLGGITKNYGTNMLTSQGDLVVAEADEYDRSFLQLHPACSVITSMDADHLDIYGEHSELQAAFRSFASQTSEYLVFKYGLPLTSSDSKAKLLTYHLSDSRADFYATNIRLNEDGHYSYDLIHPEGVIENIKVGALGWINVENSIAAAAICLSAIGMDKMKLKEGISSFLGVKRRLEVHVNRPGLCYIDDYAHHPAELNSAISSIREIFPGRKVTGIFQPHLYTRTRDFAPGFAEALSSLDKLILLDIYPAREEKIKGVDSRLIFKSVNCPEKVMLSKAELMDYLKKEELDVLMTLGAGDIDRFVPQIVEMLSSR